MTGALRETLSRELGVAVASTEPISGGDICDAYRAETADGPLFVKCRAGAPAGFFGVEADGLRWLRQADAIDVPEVAAVGDEWLAMRWIEPGRPASDAGAVFGAALARLHLAGADEFGWAADGWLGSIPVRNQPAPTWAEFFVRRRLEPLGRLAVDAGRIDPAASGLVDRVAARIDELVGPREPPARVHGDLWWGNVVWGRGGRPWLVDPAAHGGHRETDLAMLALFGGGPAGWLEAYDAAAPLATGFRDRVRLHQLTPLLVHAVLFGAGYGAQALQILREYA